eukprot:TRINITY_DN91793_c0_g1_i1.p1 TRINITY_DN91793_c0_g1~~TRINITY_DN91793_c0_g1_i1.p1  ORF type:complete len:516 (-),score=130.81 TRINITY_DN91793_c0_g1_i1:6-1499(-)
MAVPRICFIAAGFSLLDFRTAAAASGKGRRKQPGAWDALQSSALLAGAAWLKDDSRTLDEATSQLRNALTAVGKQPAAKAGRGETRQLLAQACEALLPRTEPLLHKAMARWSKDALAQLLRDRHELQLLQAEARSLEELDRWGDWLSDVAEGRKKAYASLEEASLTAAAAAAAGAESSFRAPRQLWTIEHVGDITPKVFRSSYEGRRPVVLTELAQHWPALKKWSLDYLEKAAGGAAVRATFPDRKEGWVNEVRRFDREMRRCASSAAEGAHAVGLDELIDRWALVRPPSLVVRLADALKLMGSRLHDVPIYVNQVPILEGLEPLVLDVGDIKLHSMRKNTAAYARDLFVSNAPALIGLHYDYEDNFLTMLRGEKDVLLFPPSDKEKVYNKALLEIGSSFSPDSRRQECNYRVMPKPNKNHCELNELRPQMDVDAEHAEYALANGTMVTLRPGETLYIPAGWFHAVRTRPANGLALAVNGWLDAAPQRSAATGRTEL